MKIEVFLSWRQWGLGIASNHDETMVFPNRREVYFFFGPFEVDIESRL